MGYQRIDTPASVLSSTFVRKRGADIIAVGDSITASASSGQEYSGVSRYMNLDSWFGRACALSGGALRWAGNAAVSGESSTQQLASFQAKVIDRAPDWVALLVGSNDVNQGIPIATTRANLTAMMNMAEAAGIGLILCSLIPRTSHDPDRIAGINIWLRYEAARRGAIWVDFFSVLIDAATGDPLAGLTTDGTHPSASGRAIMATKFLATVLPHIAPWNPPVAEDTTEGSGLNLITNGLFVGTPNANGEAPSWGLKVGTRDAAVTTSVTTVSGWLGNAQQISLSDAASASFVLGQYISSGFAAGDVIEFCGRFEGDTSATSSAHMAVYVICHSAANGGGSNLGAMNAVRSFKGESLSNGVFYMRGTVPTGTVSIGVYFGAQAAYESTLRVGQMALRNLTTLGVS